MGLICTGLNNTVLPEHQRKSNRQEPHLSDTSPFCQERQVPQPDRAVQKQSSNEHQAQEGGRTCSLK